MKKKKEKKKGEFTHHKAIRNAITKVINEQIYEKQHEASTVR